MSEIDIRIELFLKKKSEADAEKAAQKSKVIADASAAAKTKADAPALWAERWKQFQESARDINAKLEPAKIRVGVSPIPKPLAGNRLGHFEIVGEEDGKRWGNHYECTVDDNGNIGILRDLPGLTDSPFVRTGKIYREWIANLLMEFVENCQGLHSVNDMIRQHQRDGLY